MEILIITDIVSIIKLFTISSSIFSLLISGLDREITSSEPVGRTRSPYVGTQQPL